LSDKRSLQGAENLSEEVLRSVIAEPQQWGGLGPIGLSSHEKQSMKMKT